MPGAEWWRRWLARARQQVALADHYLAFVLLNLGDLVMTGLYFQLGGSEANGIAAWILRTFGLRGLAIFKFLLATVVIGICEALYTQRPRLARALILAGCGVYAVVILLQIRGLVMLAFG